MPCLASRLRNRLSRRSSRSDPGNEEGPLYDIFTLSIETQRLTITFYLKNQIRHTVSIMIALVTLSNRGRGYVMLRETLNHLTTNHFTLKIALSHPSGLQTIMNLRDMALSELTTEPQPLT